MKVPELYSEVKTKCLSAGTEPIEIEDFFVVVTSMQMKGIICIDDDNNIIVQQQNKREGEINEN